MSDNTTGRIENCIVLIGEELEPFFCPVFEYEDGRVTQISIDEEARYPIQSTRVLTPGFVNGHTHVGDGFLPDAATNLTLAEAFFRPNGYKYRSLREISADQHIDAICEFLRGMAASGTVGHLDFREQGLEGCRRLRAAAERTGMGSVILSQLDHSPFSEEELDENQSLLPQASLQELQEILTESDGFSESTMNDLTSPAWEQIAETARLHGKATAIHCLEDESYRDVSHGRTGKGDLIRAIELLRPDLIAHLTVADTEEIALLKRTGIPIVVNPRANATLGLPLPPIHALLQTGIPVLLGTDNGMLNGPNLLAEMDFAYKLARSQAGSEHPVYPLQIIKMVTTSPGRTRWGDQFPGTLKVGGPASFIEFDFSNPALARTQNIFATLITRCQPSDIARTLFNGKVLHQPKA